MIIIFEEMVSFLKISSILLFVNVHGFQETPRRYLKNKLLGQKVNKYREYKQLVASATHLSLDDLEKLSKTPAALFNKEHDSLTMSLDDLEKISKSPEKLHTSWENSFVAQNPKIGWETSFLTNDDNKKGDISKWNDIMKLPKEEERVQAKVDPVKGWLPTLLPNEKKIDDKEWEEIKKAVVGEWVPPYSSK